MSLFCGIYFSLTIGFCKTNQGNKDLVDNQNNQNKTKQKNQLALKRVFILLNSIEFN